MKTLLFAPGIALGCMFAAPVTAVVAMAQTPAAAPASANRQIGTVKSISGNALTVATDSGSSVAVTLPDAVRVVQLAPGSTDLKTAQPATVTDIADGDRVLVVGKPDEAGAFTASRVVLMKSSAIAQNNASRQQDWQRRGSGGIVSSVDTSASTIAITSGARKVTVTTTPSTVFRRYAPGSVKFEEAKTGTFADIKAGDQVRVRGEKSADGSSVTAEEVVSGSFRNLAGTVVSVDASANTLTLKDLASKKNVSVALTPESDLRALPPEMAVRFVARSRGAASGAGAPGAAVAGSRPASAGEAPRPEGARSEGPQAASGAGAPEGGRRFGGGSAGGDLSQVIARLPKGALTDLKPGEALMIVGSGSTTESGPVTAITLLSGVEPLLAAPQGASSFNISPWSLGGAVVRGPEAGGGPQ